MSITLKIGGVEYPMSGANYAIMRAWRAVDRYRLHRWVDWLDPGNAGSPEPEARSVATRRIAWCIAGRSCAFVGWMGCS